jgi:hypothetical protein
LKLTSFRILSLQILLIALSGFMLWRSTSVVCWIVEHPHPTSFGAVLVQSIRLDFYILSIFAICFAWPVHRLLPDSYYEAVRSKSFASACKILRIELFRTLLRRTIWNARISKRLLYNRLIFDGTRRGLAQYDNNTRRAEFIHTAAFVIILAVSLYIGIYADPLLAIGVGLVNVVWNFYPTILQRYQRSKLLAMRK